MSELNCRGCQKLIKIGEIYIDGLCNSCQNIKRDNMHKNRLDKVLSKLEQYASGKSKTIMRLGYQKELQIQYYREKFWLVDVAENGGWKHRMILSIYTVESLLADLEVQHE